MKTKTFLMAVLCLLGLDMQAQQVSLAGEWSVKLGNDPKVRQAVLPGTIDTNHLGFAPKDTMETTHLTRLFSYQGQATYSRKVRIPKEWRKKPVLLFLERTKPTWVYVDGVLVDSCNYISTPHRYVLPDMRPGEHLLTIVVDNSKGVPGQIYGSSHAYTEDTQTNWNGIIGQMYLEEWKGKAEGRSVETGEDVESHPKAFGAQASVKSSYTGSVRPCFRDFKIVGSHFYADGHKTFLRGKHDACVWPLTGHVPMDVEAWMTYLVTCREYGINHVRFHSWCPPEAAFVAADFLGIYLQPELPFWGDFKADDRQLMEFLHQEGENILREYGHHPSFRMMALGNELWGSLDEMRRFVDDFRKIAPDKYYTFGSNFYLGYQGVKPGMDYFTTCRVGGEGWGKYDTHTRGSFSFADAFDGGVINHSYPGTMLNFDDACRAAGVPVISHETGQFQTYPDYREIEKYQGVLYPYNLETFRRRLAAAGMLSQAADFHKASGLWSVQLYKADIEMDLRTRDMAGFQLLDLQDYPGQGSAYVGVLDAFMESKDITTPVEWSQWCSPVVPLLVTERFCYDRGDTLRAKVQIANYGGTSLKGKALVWSLGDRKGSFSIPDGEGLLDVGELSLPIEGLFKAWDWPVMKQHDGATNTWLDLSIEGVSANNTYELWFYPQSQVDKKGIVVTNRLTADVEAQLEKGAKVLWMPDSLPHTVGALFQTDYWNYRMFKTICEKNKKAVSPGTLGILTNPHHSIFRGFPTEMHTNWQWFDVIKHSRPLILDNFGAECQPIVQVIDNIERNHKLGILMEWQVGKGKLLVCMSNLDKVLAENHPEGKAFYASVLNYMRSEAFCPQAAITIAELRQKLAAEPRQQQMELLDNISQY